MTQKNWYFSVYFHILIYIYIYIYIYVCVCVCVCGDLRPGQTCHGKDGGSAYSIGVGESDWLNATGLKSHGTVIDWCTGREWPVNCMTVISTRWQSNMPFQGQRKWHIPMASYGGDIEWAIELLYNSVKTGSQWVWRPDPLVTRCGRGIPHPAEWATRPPVEQRWRTRKTQRWWP